MTAEEAHQQELERRRQEEEMLGGEDYLAWMMKLLEQAINETKGNSNEVRSEGKH